MANNLKLANAAVNAMAEGANGFIAICNSGKLRIFSGTQPTTADTAFGPHAVCLAELTMNATSFVNSNGVLTAEAITADSSANTAGTASWFRLFKSDGSTYIMDGSVGTASCDLNLNTTTIGLGANVAISSFVHTITKA